MKLSKRKKYSLVQSFIINSFFLLIMSAILLLYFLPNIGKIEEKKRALQSTFSQYNEIIKKGLSFVDFKSQILGGDLGKDEYTRNMLKNMEPGFYITQFTNTGSSNYDEFLRQKEVVIEEKKSQDSFIERERILNSLIPIYSKNSGESEVLNDFYFINFIERLLYSFNLSSDDSIGVGSPQPILNEKGKKQDQLSSENIYEIPISFQVTGQKKDILHFIHYFENVGKIEYSDDAIIIQTDSFISKQIEGEGGEESYNIYDNQLAIIESIELDEYPDSGITTRNMNLIDKMNITQAREKYSVKVDIKFFVAGMPTYQMRSEIESFIEEFTLYGKTFRSEVQKLIQKSQVQNGVTLESVERAKSLENLFLSFEEEIAVIKNKMKQGITAGDIGDSYLKIQEFKEKFSVIKKEIEAIITPK